MSPIDPIVKIRREISTLCAKLVSAARHGHVAYISKVDAGHTLARVEEELDDWLIAYTQSQISNKEAIQ